MSLTDKVIILGGQAPSARTGEFVKGTAGDVTQIGKSKYTLILIQTF